MAERSVVVVRAQGVAGPGTAHAAVISFAAVYGRRVHREAVEALVHDPRTPERRVRGARRRPGAFDALPAVVVVVRLAHVASRGAGAARAPLAELPAILAGGLARAVCGFPRRALLALVPPRRGLVPAGRAVDAARRAGSSAEPARVALVALGLPGGRGETTGLAEMALLLAGRGLVRPGRARGTARRSIYVAELARVALDAVDLVRRVGAGRAGHAINSQRRVGPFLAGRAADGHADQNLRLAGRADRTGRRSEGGVFAGFARIAAHRAGPGVIRVDGAERAARRAVLARVGPGGALGTGSEAVGAVRAGAAEFARRRVRWRWAGAWRRPRRRRGRWSGRRRR